MNHQLMIRENPDTKPSLNQAKQTQTAWRRDSVPPFYKDGHVAHKVAVILQTRDACNSLRATATVVTVSDVVVS